MAQAPAVVPATPPPPPNTVPARPNVIPDAVKANASKADRLMAEEQARLRGDTNAPPPPVAPIPHELRPTTEKTRAQIDPTQVPTPPPVVVAPETPPDPNAPPPIIPPVVAPEMMPPPAEPGSQDATWEQQYKSLKGRFDSQFPKLREQMDAMSAEIRRLVQENTQLQRAPQPLPVTPTAPTAAPAQPNGAVQGLSQEEVEAFGPELVDVIRRAARAEAQSMIDAGIGGVAKRVDQIGADADAVKLQGMIDFMVGKIPNFVALNSDPDLLAWLSLPDPISGVNRQQLLTQAWERRIPSQVLAIFSSYLATQSPATGQPSPAPAPAVPATPATPAPSARIPLVEFAAPGRAATSAPTVAGGPQVQKPTYTKAQIAQFYEASNRGHYRGRQAEKDAIEADIFAAQLEGRVIG